MKILLIGGCGYIGTALYDHLSPNHDVKTVDAGWWGTTNDNNFAVYYDVLTPEYINEFDAVVVTAAHSSVAMCESNPRWAMKNNVMNLVDLFAKLDDRTLCVYMSSSSVYNGTLRASEADLRFQPTNIYDTTKYMGDVMAAYYNKNIYGLRLGTVCGYSRNLRTDLMINKMYNTALQNKQIAVYNADAPRPILDINDLVFAIERIVLSDPEPGIYNIASFNSKVGDMAAFMGTFMNVPVFDQGTSPTYNFSLETRKFIRSFGFDFWGTMASIATSLRDGINEETILGERNEQIQKG